MWPYNNDESNWLEVKATSAGSDEAAGAKPFSAELEVSPEMVAAHLARGRRLQAEAVATMMRQLVGLPAQVLARIFSRRATRASHAA